MSNDFETVMDAAAKSAGKSLADASRDVILKRHDMVLLDSAAKFADTHGEDGKLNSEVRATFAERSIDHMATTVNRRLGPNARNKWAKSTTNTRKSEAKQILRVEDPRDLHKRVKTLHQKGYAVSYKHVVELGRRVAEEGEPTSYTRRLLVIMGAVTTRRKPELGYRLPDGDPCQTYHPAKTKPVKIESESAPEVTPEVKPEASAPAEAKPESEGESAPEAKPEAKPEGEASAGRVEGNRAPTDDDAAIAKAVASLHGAVSDRESVKVDAETVRNAIATMATLVNHMPAVSDKDVAKRSKLSKLANQMLEIVAQ